MIAAAPCSSVTAKADGPRGIAQCRRSGDHQRARPHQAASGDGGPAASVTPVRREGEIERRLRDLAGQTMLEA
jgi:hypothetical protein